MAAALYLNYYNTIHLFANFVTLFLYKLQRLNITDLPILMIFICFLAIVVIRYVIVSGFFQFWFYYAMKEKWKQFRLSSHNVQKKQFITELKWSLLTSVIFALVGTLTFYLWKQGYTKLYTDISAYPIYYLPISLCIALFIHETYYYWIHRWMHKPHIFKYIHKVHHNSNTTSAFTAFSFHPLEGLLQAIILPLILLLVPMHIYVLFFQLIIMTFSSVINHLEIEIYPKRFQKNIAGKWIIGATHHSLHHKQFKYNFGLYFTFWDKWIKTESPLYNLKKEKISK